MNICTGGHMYCKLLKKVRIYIGWTLHFYSKTELMKNIYLDILNTSVTKNMNGWLYISVYFWLLGISVESVQMEMPVFKKMAYLLLVAFFDKKKSLTVKG